MHTLLLYAPVDFGYEFDLFGTGPRQDAVLGRLRAELEGAGGDWTWEPEDERATAVALYGGANARAPTTRPDFLARGRLDPGSSSWVALRDAVARTGFSASRASLTVQEYGIGVFELRIPLDADRGEPRDGGREADFGGAVGALIEDAGAIGALRRAAGAASAALLDAADAAELPLFPAGEGLVHRNGVEEESGRPHDRTGADDRTGPHEPTVLWFHSLLLVDNRSGELGAAGTPDWCRSIAEAGVFPLERRFYDRFLSFRCVRPTAFVTRDVMATVFLGWGTSAVFVGPPTEPGALDGRLPIDEVMLVLQAFSGGLLRLNAALLREATRHALPRRWLSHGQYRRRLARLDEHRVHAEMFAALLEEQRYSQSSREQVLWDAAVEAWELDRLLGNIRQNGSLLRTMYRQQRDLLDDRVKRRVSLGVSLVTLLSAAGVAFTMADSLLGGPDWSRAAVQVVIVAALLAVSILLLRRPRKPGLAAGG